MAKINFGGIVQDARGKQNGIVYSKNKFGPYVRRKVTPANPQSTAQVAVRNTFSSLSKAWSNTLNATQRAAWTAFAAVYPRRDIFGNSVTLTGANMYIALNGVLQKLGATLLTSPPASQAVTATGVGTLAASFSGATMTFQQTDNAGGANTKLYIFGAPPSPAGRQPAPSKFVFLEALTPGTTAFPISTTVYTVYTARFGAAAIGSMVSLIISTASTLNGAVTPGQKLQTIVLI
jgi:hypothetical protein